MVMHIEKKNCQPNSISSHQLMVLGETARGMWSEVVYWWWFARGKGVRTPAERAIRFEGDPNWLYTMGTRETNQF